jgi:hypothetical protein
MTIHIPTAFAPTAILQTPPSQQNPDTQPNIAAGTGPTFGPMNPAGAGIPVIQGNGLTGTTNPPALVNLAVGAVSANANPTNALYAAGLTSVLAQMATGQLSHAGQLTLANPCPHNGH